MKLFKDVPSISLPIIATPEYFIANGAIDYGYIVEDGIVLPFYIKRNAIFRIMLFTTGVIGCSSKKHEQLFLDNLIVFVKRNISVDCILMQHTTALFSVYPEKARACRFGSYILDLRKSEDELFIGLHPKHRNVIKKAAKDGIFISSNLEDISDCIKLVQNTLNRQGVVFQSSDFFMKLKESLGNNIDFWIARNGNELQGAAIIAWSKGNYAYYLYGGSAVKPYAGSMNLLQWEVIKKMKKRGVTFYDFVGARIEPDSGSKYEGIQRFKERFGGHLEEGYLWKFPIRTVMYNLYFFALKAKCLLKGIANYNDIIDHEYKRMGL